MVVGFDTTAQLATDLIDDAYKADRGHRLLRPGGGTAMYDAIYYACRDKLGMDQPKSDYRRQLQDQVPKRSVKIAKPFTAIRA